MPYTRDLGIDLACAQGIVAEAEFHAPPLATDNQFGFAIVGVEEVARIVMQSIVLAPYSP
jgi:hypothetical protein